uniref:Uncharacterized protein n=1 Tax=Rhizophora mucronata TaxID=61149 RepID=A0A2P2PVL6_RHIMU
MIVGKCLETRIVLLSSSTAGNSIINHNVCWIRPLDYLGT